MPTYNYVCQLCGAHFEKRLGFQDNPDQVVCPNGHVQIRRIFTPPAILFKGKGFYVTDSRSGHKESSGD